VRLTVLPAVLFLLFVGACGMSGGAGDSRAVDLLQSIDLERDVVDGEWYREDGCLLSTQHKTASGSDVSWISVPVEFPEEFELTFVGTTVNGRHGPGFNIQHLGRKFGVGFDRWSSTKSGMGPLDGVGIDKNELAVEHNVPVFPSGRPVTLRIEVRKDGVKATAGDWVVVDYRGSLERLGNFEGFEFWTDQSLMIGIWRTAIRISKLEVRPL
jgi:hypothetical protein